MDKSRLLCGVLLVLVLVLAAIMASPQHSRTGLGDADRDRAANRERDEEASKKCVTCPAVDFINTLIDTAVFDPVGRTIVREFNLTK